MMMDPSLPSEIKDWTPEQVAHWVCTHLKLPKYRDNFLDNEISGKDLADLSNVDLKDMDIHAVGPRKTILREVQYLLASRNLSLSGTRTLRESVSPGSPGPVDEPVRRLKTGEDAPVQYHDNGSGQYTIKVLMGNANRKLGEGICEHLGLEASPCDVKKFADGEISLKIRKNMRGADVFVIQPTCPPVNDHLMELLLMLHTLKLSSAKRITAVIPYFGYARQDRKTTARVPISAAAVSQLIESMNVDRVVTVDLHCGQIQGFFRHVPVDNLYAENQFLDYLSSTLVKHGDHDWVIVSPDAGGVYRARRMADKLGVENVATIIKRRIAAGEVAEMQIVGIVKGKRCVIVDDMIDTAGTLCKAAQLLKDNEATQVYACATHGVFSGPAMERINESVLEKVIVTDSIPQDENVEVCPKIEVRSIASLLAEVVKRLHSEKSLSVLFDKKYDVKAPRSHME